MIVLLNTHYVNIAVTDVHRYTAARTEEQMRFVHVYSFAS